jgi:hypothetical protein
MPRNHTHAATRIVAVIDRTVDWISGGISWIASFTAT